MRKNPLIEAARGVKRGKSDLSRDVQELAIEWANGGITLAAFAAVSKAPNAYATAAQALKAAIQSGLLRQVKR